MREHIDRGLCIITALPRVWRHGNRLSRHVRMQCEARAPINDNPGPGNARARRGNSHGRIPFGAHAAHDDAGSHMRFSPVRRSCRVRPDVHGSTTYRCRSSRQDSANQVRSVPCDRKASNSAHRSSLRDVGTGLACHPVHGDGELLRDQAYVNGECLRESCAESLEVSARDVRILTLGVSSRRRIASHGQASGRFKGRNFVAMGLRADGKVAAACMDGAVAAAFEER